MPANLHVRALSGCETLEKVIELVTEASQQKTIQQLSISPEGPIANITLNMGQEGFDGSLAKPIPRLDELREALADYTFIPLSSIVCVFSSKAKLDYKYTSGTPTAQFVITDDNTTRTQPVCLALLKGIRDSFDIVPSNAIQSELFTEVQQQTLKAYETSLQSLREILHKSIANVAEHSEKWDDKIREMTGKLQATYDEREKTLTQKYTEQEESLKQQRQKLEEKERDFDDRERMHVRRDLLNEIKAVIQQQRTFDLSEETRQKHGELTTKTGWIAVIMIGLFIGSFVSLGIYLARGTNPSWGPCVVGLPVTVLAISSVVYYLKLKSKWYREHADVEFFNLKFNSDMLRASWLVEMFFEWRKESDQQDMPVELMTTLSKGLFEPMSGSKDVKHPMESLFDTVDRVKKLRFGKNIVEVEAAERPSKT